MSETASLSSRGVRKATEIRKESEELLRSRGIPEGTTMMAPKPAPAALPATPVMIKTNLFPVRFSKDKETRVFRYDLTITGHVNEQPRYDFTRRSGSDVQIVDRKEKCRAAFDLLVAAQSDLMPPREECVYDSQAILFTFRPIRIEERTNITLELDETAQTQVLDTRSRPMFANSTSLVFSIKPVSHFDLVLSNATVQASVSDDLEQQRNDIQQFVEILTSQNALTESNEHVTFQGGRSYLMRPDEHGFQADDCPELGRGAYLAIGAQKSCKIVEGPKRGDPRLMVVVENKKTPFHIPHSVTEKLLTAFPHFDPRRPNDVAAAVKLLRDLWVTTTYDQQADFQIRDLKSSASEHRFDFQGQNISVADYFRGLYGIELEYPQWPLIVTKGRDGQPNYYPIEVCVICDNQRLTSNQLTPDQTASIILTCARPPRDQFRHIEANFKALKVNASEVMGAAGVAIGEDPIKMRGKCVQHPAIRFEGGDSRFDPSRGDWKPGPGSRYLLPARITTWAIYCLAPQRLFNAQAFETFISTFVQRCRQQGMTVAPPAEKIYIGDAMELRDRFQAAAQCEEPCDLIMVITDKNDSEIHTALKSLEQEFDIVTQNVTHKIALDSIKPTGGRLTLANVVNKTNMKTGGLNYAIYPAGSRFPLGEDDLFIGFGVNHPGGYASESEKRTGGAPSVVGYAANDLEHPCAFSGDYVYQESRRDEKVAVIESIVQLVVERFQRNRGKNPKRLFIFRNGCSEGQFAGILRFEVPLIENTLRSLGVEAGVSVIVPNRMHNLRFAPDKPQGEKAWEQNLSPGTVIDSVVNHPRFFDFYLLSHLARMGTAKVPRYTMLYDSNRLSSEEAISIAYVLCFGHQIINGPTSFPTPVYIAGRYAERGRAVYNEYQRSGLAHQDMRPLLEEFNQRLTYLERRSRNVRFNA